VSFPEIAERGATGPIFTIYEDIRTVLQVPIVNLIFRHLATIPGCLPWVWGILRPHYESPAMEEAVVRVLSQARSLRSPWGPSLICSSGSDLAEVRKVADFYNVSNASNLIALSALRLAVESGLSSCASPKIDHAARVQAPPFHRSPKLDELEVGIALKIRDIAAAQDSADLAIIPTMYLHLAHLRGVADQILDGVKASLLRGTLRHDAEIVRDEGRVAAVGLYPRLVEQGERPAEADILRLNRALDAFTNATIPQMLLIGAQIVETARF
jgi:hypothetical protein